MRQPINRRTLSALLLVALGICAAASLLAGDVAVHISAVWTWLRGGDTENSQFYAILFEQIRSPRIVLAAMTGFVLGLSGAAIQGLFRNPLAEPGLLGASNGAALGAVMVIYLGLASTLSIAVPLAAAGMALVSVLVLLALAGRGASSLRLILAGFAVSAFAGAGIALALNLSPNYFAALEIAFWLLGAVENRSWLHVGLALPGAALGSALMLATARTLDGLALGEEVSRSLGISLLRLRLQISIGLALAVGAVVSVTGVIGFVGLLAPHLVRPFTGALPSKTLLPAGLVGAILLVLADSLIRLIPTMTELKLGVLTAFLGVPLLLLLLTRPGASLLSER
ncbi:MAG: iron chelate uptake ABC transporter family permease subunit [Alphaproteobacteria bacterium]|nr:iron chelate uptake ABC transporter family permease subunit [Alphaproteobacteria bacterium]